MDEDTKAKLKAAGLEGVITAFEKQATDHAAAIKTMETEHAAAIAEKDAIITTKTNDVVGARKEYKLLKDMTEAEKASMSEKEIELQERQEAFDARVGAFEKQQQEFAQKEVAARRAEAIRKIAGTDPELTKKIEDNYGRIKDSELAQTPEEVARVVGEAFNMTGQPRPDPVRQAIQGGGNGEAGGGVDGGFAETTEGKSLASAMGLPEVKADGATPPAPAPAPGA